MVLAIQVPLVSSTELVEYQYILAILITAFFTPTIGMLCEERD